MTQSSSVGAASRKKRLTLLQDSLSRIRVDLATHKISSVKECLDFLGLSEYGSLELARRISVSEFNKLIAFPYEDELRNTLAKEAENERLGIFDTPNSSVGGAINVSDSNELQVGFHAHHPLDDTEWAFKSEHPCVLFPHQNKAAKDVLWKFHVDGYRATLLQAGVGVGKTYIYGKVAKEMWHRKWFYGKTFSPWPMLIITKASIVEQTRRVMLNDFGLAENQFKVLNYDALRSSKGLDTVINWEYKVSDGVRKKIFNWKLGIEPIYIVVDECQSAKNETSQQSEIIQTMATITNPNVKILFSSATPFTRISEAKYLCVNLGMEYRL